MPVSSVPKQYEGIPPEAEKIANFGSDIKNTVRLKYGSSVLTDPEQVLSDEEFHELIKQKIIGAEISVDDVVVAVDAIRNETGSKRFFYTYNLSVAFPYILYYFDTGELPKEDIINEAARKIRIYLPYEVLLLLESVDRASGFKRDGFDSVELLLKEAITDHRNFRYLINNSSLFGLSKEDMFFKLIQIGRNSSSRSLHRIYDILPMLDSHFGEDARNIALLKAALVTDSHKSIEYILNEFDIYSFPDVITEVLIHRIFEFLDSGKPVSLPSTNLLQMPEETRSLYISKMYEMMHDFPYLTIDLLMLYKEGVDEVDTEKIYEYIISSNSINEYIFASRFILFSEIYGYERALHLFRILFGNDYDLEFEDSALIPVVYIGLDSNEGVRSLHSFGPHFLKEAYISFIDQYRSFYNAEKTELYGVGFSSVEELAAYRALTYLEYIDVNGEDSKYVLEMFNKLSAKSRENLLVNFVTLHQLRALSSIVDLLTADGDGDGLSFWFLSHESRNIILEGLEESYRMDLILGNDNSTQLIRNIAQKLSYVFGSRIITQNYVTNDTRRPRVAHSIKKEPSIEYGKFPHIPPVNVAREAAKFYLSDAILSELESITYSLSLDIATQEGITRAQVEEFSRLHDRITYANLLYTFEKYKNNILSIYDWLRKYIFVAVNSELKWQMDPIEDVSAYLNDNIEGRNPSVGKVLLSGTIPLHSRFPPNKERIRLFFQTAEARFRDEDLWTYGYGGKTWAQIARLGLYMFYGDNDDISDRLEPITLTLKNYDEELAALKKVARIRYIIDMAFDIQHNTGNIFDKDRRVIDRRSKIKPVNTAILSEFLDFKARNLSFEDLVMYSVNNNLITEDEAREYSADYRKVIALRNKKRRPRPYD